MYERFTDRSRKVMRLAEYEARRCGREEIGTEHVLLALAREGNGVAAHILKDLNANAARMRSETEKLGEVENAAEDGAPGERVHLQRLVDYAMDEACGLGHNYVGTEHLLLGLLREPESKAMKILLGLGLNPAEVRQEVLSLLGRA